MSNDYVYLVCNCRWNNYQPIKILEAKDHEKRRGWKREFWQMQHENQAKSAIDSARSLFIWPSIFGFSCLLEPEVRPIKLNSETMAGKGSLDQKQTLSMFWMGVKRMNPLWHSASPETIMETSDVLTLRLHFDSESRQISFSLWNSSSLSLEQEEEEFPSPSKHSIDPSQSHPPSCPSPLSPLPFPLSPLPFPPSKEV